MPARQRRESEDKGKVERFTVRLPAHLAETLRNCVHLEKTTLSKAMARGAELYLQDRGYDEGIDAIVERTRSKLKPPSDS